MYLTVTLVRADWDKSIVHQIPYYSPLKKLGKDQTERRMKHFLKFIDEVSEQRPSIETPEMAAVAEWLMDAKCGDMLRITGDYKKRSTVILTVTDNDPRISVLKKTTTYVAVDQAEADWDDEEEEDDSDDEEDDSDDDEEDEEDEKPRARRGPTKC